MIPNISDDRALEKWFPIAKGKSWLNIVKKWTENIESVMTSEIVNTEQNSHRNPKPETRNTVTP